MNLPEEIERGIVMPVQIYPMFETALRAASGRTVDEHQRFLGELYADLSEVAADEPTRVDPGGQDRRGDHHRHRIEPDDRLPVPEADELEQRRRHGCGAHHVLGRSGRATRDRGRALGVSPRRYRRSRAPVRVAPRHVRHDAGRRARRTDGAGARPAWTSTTCRSSICTRASRPPCSSARSRSASTSHRVGRQWSRTGGLTFAGGPWNNYVDARDRNRGQDLREQPGEYGFVWANGGYATKHAFGVYRTTPPTTPFRHALAAGRGRRTAAAIARRPPPRPPAPRRSRRTR